MPNIFGTPRNDTLEGTPDIDHIEGRAGDDIITGGAGDDDIFGGDGDDTIDGGADDDVISGGTGANELSGGAGADQFYALSIGDTIDGGDGFDRIFLEGVVPAGGRAEIVHDADIPQNGSITIFDADDVALGDIAFTNIEKIDDAPVTPPCFTPGTRIATLNDERKVETLAVGDRVITRDNGIQEILWIGRCDLDGPTLANAPHLWPVLLQKGALGDGLPERDMLVSPNHRVLVANDKAALYFEEREVLVAAKHLTGLAGVDIVEVSHISYIHIMFAQHEVVLSDGTWTESFQPGEATIAGVGPAQRAEILELFPQLAEPVGMASYRAARRSLKRHEAKLLTD